MTQPDLFDTACRVEMPGVGTLTLAPSLPPPIPPAPMPAPANVPKGQADAILHWLRDGHSITPIQALHLYGCFRLGARILELRHRGYNIETKMITTAAGKRVAEYRLAGTDR